MSKRSLILGIALIALLFVVVGFGGPPIRLAAAPVQQATATATPTSTATNTPAPTATAVNTPRPLFSDPSNYATGNRVGRYGATPVVQGSVLQIFEGGSIDLYSVTGQNTVRIDGVTGDVTASGAVIGANGAWKCVNSNITGSITATPVSGATPIGNPLVSIGAVTGDAARAYGSYNAGTFTIGVSNSALTPTANTTPAAVEWCYTYSK